MKADAVAWFESIATVLEWFARATPIQKWC